MARGIFCCGGLFVAVHGLLSSCGSPAPECVGSLVVLCGLSSCGAWAPEHVGSVVGDHGLSSCGLGLVAPWHVGS